MGTCIFPNWTGTALLKSHCVPSVLLPWTVNTETVMKARSCSAFALTYAFVHIITDTCCQTVTKDRPIPARHSRLTTNWLTAFAAVFYADHSRDSWYDLDHSSLFTVPIVMFIRKISQTKCIRFQTLIVFFASIYPSKCFVVDMRELLTYPAVAYSPYS